MNKKNRWNDRKEEEEKKRIVRKGLAKISKGALKRLMIQNTRVSSK
jgi:hypothetical protein